MAAEEDARAPPGATQTGSSVPAARGSGEAEAMPGSPGEQSPVTEFVQRRFDSLARSTVNAFRALSGQDAARDAGGAGAQARASLGAAQAPAASLSSERHSRAPASRAARGDSSGSGAGPLTGVPAGGARQDSEPAALGAVRAWLLRRAMARSSAEEAKRRREEEEEEAQARESWQRLEVVRANVRGALAVLGKWQRLGLPETSWKNKMPYREPRAEFLARGLKWPEEQHFESEAEKRRYLRYIRKVQPFLFGDIPSWSWLAADIGLFVFLTINPRWPWTLD